MTSSAACESSHHVSVAKSVHALPPAGGYVCLCLSYALDAAYPSMLAAPTWHLAAQGMPYRDIDDEVADVCGSVAAHFEALETTLT